MKSQIWCFPHLCFGTDGTILALQTDSVPRCGCPSPPSFNEASFSPPPVARLGETYYRFALLCQ